MGPLAAWAPSGRFASAALAFWERPSIFHRRVRLLLDRDYRVEKNDFPAMEARRGSAGSTDRFPPLDGDASVRPAVTAQEMMAKEKARTCRQGSTPAAPTGDRFEYTGRVVDSDEKPVAAKNASGVFWISWPGHARGRATSDRSAGSGSKWAGGFVASTHETPWTTVQVVAKAAGFGLGWADTSNEEIQTSSYAI